MDDYMDDYDEINYNPYTGAEDAYLDTYWEDQIESGWWGGEG